MIWRRSLLLLFLFSSFLLQLHAASAPAGDATEPAMNMQEKVEKSMVVARKLKSGGGRGGGGGGGRSPISRGGGAGHGNSGRSAACSSYDRSFGITFLAVALAAVFVNSM
ncbi:hypothetical protein Cni_G11018 [Canna indica]|uniref:Glycine-rich protein n=1 Tax=Canna indica TaxID=4628 RepID=A0AAQ3K704_9LILI|nr:hypothetical protein Cni_G11018 [Canna indica]